MNKQIEKEILIGADLLKRGELVVFPTETVYGLGGDASNPISVNLIYKVKQRPRNHPLIVHLSDISKLETWAIDISDSAWELAKEFWPGPLTLIMKKSPSVISEVTGGHNTIAIRVPSHPIAHKLLEIFDGGVAAPSANYFGRLSPTSAEHVHRGLGADVKLVIDGGRCKCGLESTIVDVSGVEPNILRFGAIGVKELRKVISIKLPKDNMKKIAAPGTLLAHYAPRKKMHIVKNNDLEKFILLLTKDNKKITVLAIKELIDCSNQLISCIKMPSNVDAYSYEMFESLHKADESDSDEIVVEDIPHTDEWLAVRDRLKKAERGSKE